MRLGREDTETRASSHRARCETLLLVSRLFLFFLSGEMSLYPSAIGSVLTLTHPPDCEIYTSISGSHPFTPPPTPYRPHAPFSLPG